jgi:hypothetical protein
MALAGFQDGGLFRLRQAMIVQDHPACGRPPPWNPLRAIFFWFNEKPSACTHLSLGLRSLNLRMVASGVMSARVTLS